MCRPFIGRRIKAGGKNASIRLRATTAAADTTTTTTTRKRNGQNKQFKNRTKSAQVSGGLMRKI